MQTYKQWCVDFYELQYLATRYVPTAAAVAVALPAKTFIVQYTPGY